jgi:hypothetical protein
VRACTSRCSPPPQRRPGRRCPSFVTHLHRLFPSNLAVLELALHRCVLLLHLRRHGGMQLLLVDLAFFHDKATMQWETKSRMEALERSSRRSASRWRGRYVVKGSTCRRARQRTGLNSEVRGETWVKHSVPLRKMCGSPLPQRFARLTTIRGAINFFLLLHSSRWQPRRANRRPQRVRLSAKRQ